MSQPRSGVVSVVMVNFRGSDDTLSAVKFLHDLKWPAELLEIIVVENGSGDGSADRLRAESSGFLLVESPTNLGFAGGCNLGVSRSSGEFVAFLNNDARPDEQWISAALALFSESPSIGAVASKVVDWDGVLVDYIGSAMTWYGQGYKPATGEPVPSDSDEPRDVLFGTGSAMFVRRTVFDQLRGFDERFFMFFEDVDFGWRLNLAGHRFAYAAKSVAYHKHHASMAGYGEHKEHYLLERNALYTLYKNASDETLASALPATMALAVRRGISRAGVDSTKFDLRMSGPDDVSLEIGADAVAPLFAIDQFAEHLPALHADRKLIQSSRRVSDAAIWRLFGEADAPIFHQADYLRGYENIVVTFDVALAPRSTRVLIITGDPIGTRLAGPAIRAWNMAQILSKEHDVTLVTFSRLEPIVAGFEVASVRPGDDRTFSKFEKWADVIVFQGDAMAVFDSLRRTHKIVVVDVYDPMHLEQLEQSRGLGAGLWHQAVENATMILNEQLERGDFFLAASERQRHFYLGQLAGLGRVNTATYNADSDLRGLIDVVPFGMSDVRPVHTRNVLRGVRPGISSDDKVIIWGGGLYNWFDPETLIRAIARLSVDRPNVRLFFQGTKHPHPGVPEMDVVARSRALAVELGVLDRHVFFNDSWVEYNDRQNYLLEADAAVSTHFEHVETTFSFRTRVIDYLWAELPMVLTAGDHFAELATREGTGLVVPANDVDALVSALDRVLFDEPLRADMRANISRVRDRFTWDRVLDPLVAFLRNPSVARDREPDAISANIHRGVRIRQRRSGLLYDIKRTTHYLKNGGPGLVLVKIRNRFRR